jgi:hypothetical protein
VRVGTPVTMLSETQLHLQVSVSLMNALLILIVRSIRHVELQTNVQILLVLVMLLMSVNQQEFALTRFVSYAQLMEIQNLHALLATPVTPQDLMALFVLKP